MCRCGGGGVAVRIWTERERDSRSCFHQYRLIFKETVEEKILQKASQKNTVQLLGMTGGHVQGDLLAPEDVVSLLLDDAQLERKLREAPLQGKDKQKKKRGTKGIRVDAEGVATFEDFATIESQNVGSEVSHETEAGNKKRKANSDKQTPLKRLSESSQNCFPYGDE